MQVKRKEDIVNRLNRKEGKKGRKEETKESMNINLFFINLISFGNMSFFIVLIKLIFAITLINLVFKQ
jgi:predicted HTH domain antitoxin